MKNRRHFLAQGGIFFLEMAGIKPAAAQNTQKTAQWGMVIDLNRCTGCQACVIACKTRNHTARGQFNCRIEIQNNHNGRLLFTPVQCNHCNNPACVEACTEQATFQLANGIVVIDWDRCQGDGACIEACPFGVRFADPAHHNKVDKCDFCLDRITEGLLPSCVEACASGARLFGNTHSPKGEFSSCLKRPDLTTAPSKILNDTAVKYIPNRHNKRGLQ